MGMDNLIFLENLEWFDQTGRELAQRLPPHGSGEIKWGAQLTVRESQAAVFYYKGKAIDAFAPGRHTLKTGNIPVLTKILSVPWGMTSPLRAEMYFVNMKVFPNLKWGTRDPVAFKDEKLGLVRLRAHGVFNIRVLQPVLFVNALVGTKAAYTVDDIEEYVSRVIVSRLNDVLGEELDSLLDLPGRYDDFSANLQKRLVHDLAHFGLGLQAMYINSITPPPEVQQAIDDASRLSVLTDLDGLARMKAAMAMEEAARNPGEAGAGMGLGLGMLMPAMFGPLLSPSAKDRSLNTQACQSCGMSLPENARFCPHCGKQQLIQNQCRSCGAEMPSGARFCPECGKSADQPETQRFCTQCGTANLANAVFCNHCGERLAE